MSKLNCKTDTTKKIIHLLITTLCNRDCKNCCNKQYDLNDISYVTDEELKEAEVLCLTGGEPFLFTDPCQIAAYYKTNYKNIKKIYVYTNAAELAYYLAGHGLYYIDGLSISIKNEKDMIMFERDIAHDKSVLELESNRLYVFDHICDCNPEGFEVIQREWQEDFEPAPDSIFRRV